MRKMLPLAVFVGVAVVCQCVAVIAALILDQLGYHWFSIIAFGVLYLGMFAAAWKITVFIVDGYLVPKGLVEDAQPESKAPAPMKIGQPKEA